MIGYLTVYFQNPVFYWRQMVLWGACPWSNFTDFFKIERVQKLVFLPIWFCKASTGMTFCSSCIFAWWYNCLFQVLGCLAHFFFLKVFLKAKIVGMSEKEKKKKQKKSRRRRRKRLMQCVTGRSIWGFMWAKTRRSIYFLGLFLFVYCLLPF